MRQLSISVLGVCASAGAALACPSHIGVGGRPMPGEGETWPANAAILVPGNELDLEALSATVDGAPARLVAAPHLDYREYRGDQGDLSWSAAFVEPTPAPGERVAIEGNPCADPSSCEAPFALTYVAGPPDEAPPPAPTSVWFDLHAHGELPPPFPGECDPDSGDATWLVSFRVAADEGAPAFVRLEGRGQSAEWRGGATRELAAGEHSFVVIGSVPRGFEGEALAEATCYRVVAFDVAGHEAPSAEACRPCHFVDDPTPLEEGEWPARPAWGPENAYPMGICAENAPSPPPPPPPPPDLGVADMGVPADGAPADQEASTDDDEGCNAAGSGAGGVAALLVLLLGLVRHRRR